ncbi:hypothetical protein AWZ03_010563 [Drosophila navojoa]|uniref:LITAF domain-containing protein n=1 Tax=Drosophila navojoa TaxID=7232 RepID=A0A484B5C4_DRONA|nr:lipopolysaccharide-induced tumor necrosis factor-alpha factor-like [Drosophila navojoa]TDG43041.1 hypothetical protein AWZ03_010563 [Drosophila navojoa]
MEYSKLPPQPPPYSPEQYGAGPSAPPTEQIHAALAAQPPRPDVHVVNTNHVVVDSSGLTTCPRCNKRIMLRTKRHATCTTYLWAAVLCLLACWPCVCLPCCCEWGYQSSPACPKCNARF